MGILTCSEIKKEIKKGNIEIKPFNEKNLNPNGYNITLADEIVVYKNAVLDAKKVNETETLKIPEEGMVLYPGVLYLARTVEYTNTKNHVPMLEGRSSTGRLGINIHICAGAGDVGFAGTWTLEISVIHPVRIYAGMQVGQIMYHEISGKNDNPYRGKYQNQFKVKSSHLYEDFGISESCVNNVSSLTELENKFKEAIESGARSISVYIKTEGVPGLETITNPAVNFESKLEYYKKAYREDLKLKTYDKISILGCSIKK